MNNVRTGVRSVWKRSWTFLGVILQRFGSERVITLFLCYCHIVGATRPRLINFSTKGLPQTLGETLLRNAWYYKSSKESSAKSPLRKAAHANSLRKAHLGVPLSPAVGRNILAIYAGKWVFMRILLPQVYRELKSNGGILDEVWLMIIRVDNSTKTKIKNFVQVANEVQEKQYLVYTESQLKQKTILSLIMNSSPT